MYKSLITIVFLFAALVGSPQMPTLKWAVSFDKNNASNYRVNSNGRSVGVDGQGNVYSAGLFHYSVDFDPGPGVYSLDAGSSGSTAIYISKLDSNGKFVWAVQIPSSISFGHIEIKVDPTGNVYLASYLSNTADMDPGPGVHLMSKIGVADAFVLKLDKDANFIWAKQFGGPGDTGADTNILEIDVNNNVIVTGTFSNTVDFDPGPGTLNLTSAAHTQAFIVKLNSNGDLIGAKQFGTSPIVYQGSSIKNIKADTFGNIYAIGNFTGTVDFDPGNGIYTATSSAGSINDGFICKLDPDFNFVWVKTLGQVAPSTYNGFISPMGLDIDNLNNLVICGSFIGNFDFDPGPAVQSISNNPYESYILKLDPLGNFIWVRTIGNPGEYDTGNDVMVDSGNDIYLIGSFGKSVDFDPGPGVHIINSPNYGAEAVVKLTSAGNFRFAAPFQSISDGSGVFRRMAMDADRNIYVTGFVSGTVDFDPGPGVFPLSGPMDQAPFVLKLSRCRNITTSTLIVSSCNSYTLNNETYNSSGTYEQIIPNLSGCDSVITLHLSINTKFFEQTKSICSGENFFAGGTNQSTAGIYYDTLQTVLGCDSIIKTILKVNPKPSPNLGADGNLCSNTSRTLSPGPFATYLWQDNSNNASFVVSSPGQYWVRVVNEFSCATTDTVNVFAIVEAPSNFLQKTDSVCTYKSLELVPSQPFASYLWSTGAIQKNIEVRGPGIYRLRVTDINGCTGSDSTIVFEKQCLTGVYIPTGFTPDNNGKNDLFKPLVFGKLQQFKLTVYNRWGAIVFQTTDPEKGWDGRLSGTMQDNAVFIWVCSYQLEGVKPRTEKGTVMLIR